MKGSRRAESREGIVLILVSVLVVLLAAVAMAVLSLRAFANASARTRLATGAGLSAGSGMEYAAARLRPDPSPRWDWSLATRGDDWACRDGAGNDPAHRLNPSFSHGELWIDNARQGVYERGTDGVLPGADRDGDGAFSAWTGRLRGGRGPGLNVFSLSVEPLDGKIPVNAGYLARGDADGVDNNLDGFIDEPGEDRNGNITPDHRDLSFPYHLGLAHVLNNLGVICGVRHRREDVPSGNLAGVPGEPIQACRLGFDLVWGRPEGGYRAWGEVERVLLSVSAPGGPYDREDLRRIRPFLDMGPYMRPPTAGGVDGYVPISFPAAPDEVLRACWTYLNTLRPSLFSEPGAGDAPCDRTGPAATVPPTRKYAQVLPLIFPDEAERLAAKAEEHRRAGPPAWRGLYDRLSAGAEWAFERDAAALAAFPIYRRGWIQTKVDAAFQAVAIDAYPYPISGIQVHGSATWAGWGIDRNHDPSDGVQQALHAFVGRVSRVPYPAEHGAGWGAATFTPYTTAGAAMRPQGFTMAHPFHFRIASVGKSRSEQGWISVGREGEAALLERIDLSTQEDFECWSGGGALAGSGIRVVDPSPETRREIRLDGVRRYPHVASLPRWSRRSIYPSPAQGNGYSTASGAIGLAAREAGNLDAQLYWPLSEDFDGAENTVSPPPETEFWSEPGGGYGYGPYRLPVYLYGGDTQMFGPYGVSCYYSDTSWRTYLRNFQAPGLHQSTNGSLDEMSIEAWMATNSKVYLNARGAISGVNFSYADRIRILATRPLPPSTEVFSPPTVPPYPGARGTYFTVAIGWAQEGPGGMVGSRYVFFIADRDTPLTRSATSHHVVVAIEKIAIEFAPGAFRPHIRVRLFVDGSDKADDYCALTSQVSVTWGGPKVMEYEHFGSPGTQDTGTMWMTDPEYLRIEQADEVRLYEQALTLDRAKDRFETERFVRKGSFTSPLYDFQGPVRLQRAQWTGLVPPALLEAVDAADPVRSPGDPARPIDPFRVEVEAFLDADGNDPHPDNPFPLAPSGQIAELGGAGTIRSMRYRVRFDCLKAAGVMNDTPLFESIWLAWSRSDGPVQWTGWSAR